MTAKKTEKANSGKIKETSGRKFLSWLVAILLALFFITTVLFGTVSHIAFHSELYKKSLVQSDFYNRLINDGVPSMIMETQSTDADLTDRLVRQGIVFIFQKLVPPDWVQQQTETIIDNTFSYLKTTDTSKESQVKNLLGKFDSQLVDNFDAQLGIIEMSIPTCEQVALPTLFPGVNCEEMDQTLNNIKTEISTGRQQLNEITPELLETNAEIQRDIDILINLKKSIHDLPYYFAGSLIILALLSLGIIFLKRKDIPGLLKWLSLPYFISAAITLIAAGIMKHLSLNYIARLNLETTSEMETILTDLMNTVVKNLFLYPAKIGWAALIISAVVFAAGMLLEKIDLKKALHAVEKKFEAIEKKIDKKKKK